MPVIKPNKSVSIKAPLNLCYEVVADVSQYHTFIRHCKDSYFIDEQRNQAVMVLNFSIATLEFKSDMFYEDNHISSKSFDCHNDNVYYINTDWQFDQKGDTTNITANMEISCSWKYYIILSTSLNMLQEYTVSCFVKHINDKI